MAYPLTLTEGEPIFKIRNQNVPVVKIRAATTNSKVAEVADFRSGKIDQVILNTRIIIDGMGVSIVYLHGQIVCQPVVHTYDQSVVVGRTEVADESGSSILSEQPYVGEQKSLTRPHHSDR